jgi:hypothetical protein
VYIVHTCKSKISWHVVGVQVCSVGLNILVRVAVQTCHIAYTQICAGGEKGRGACQVSLTSKDDSLKEHSYEIFDPRVFSSINPTWVTE